ncbi:MAG: hypothetical protein IPK87_17380 [Planctomycetes bacterium]|nr:hypothetical protein [Planctomycetota bacterium]
MSAAAPAQQFLSRRPLEVRVRGGTASRLIEMQSRDYLARVHVAS